MAQSVLVTRRVFNGTLFLSLDIIHWFERLWGPPTFEICSTPDHVVGFKDFRILKKVSRSISSLGYYLFLRLRTELTVCKILLYLALLHMVIICKIMSSQTWVFPMDQITIKAHQFLPQTASTNKFSFHDEKLLPRFTNFPRFYNTRHAKLSPFCIFFGWVLKRQERLPRTSRLFEVKYWVWRLKNWCLIEFIDERYSQSCWYFRPALLTFSPLTFCLVSSPPPFFVWISILYTRVHCVRGGVWGQRRGGGLRQIKHLPQNPITCQFC